jgi:hypothetical protein
MFIARDFLAVIFLFFTLDDFVLANYVHQLMRVEMKQSSEEEFFSMT